MENMEYLLVVVIAPIFLLVVLALLSVVIGPSVQEVIDNRVQQKSVEPKKETYKEPSKSPEASEEPENKDGDDGFSTSFAVGALTNSTMLGYMAGGNLTGAMMGDFFNSND